VQRVLIVGGPGAGKSTAAKALSEVTGLPVIHLDRHYWQPGWTPSTGDAWRTTVKTLADEPRWIMEGNYSGSLPYRLTLADTLIHLDFPTGLCFWRVLRRTALGWGRSRDDAGPECPQRFDREFLSYALHYRRDQREKDIAQMRGFTGDVRHFTRPAELAAFIAAQREVFGTNTKKNLDTIVSRF
jgi:adenylate kinase family enzyme